MSIVLCYTPTETGYALALESNPHVRWRMSRRPPGHLTNSRNTILDMARVITHLPRAEVVAQGVKVVDPDGSVVMDIPGV